METRTFRFAVPAALAALATLILQLPAVVAQTVFVANDSGSSTTAYTILKFDARGNGGIWVSNNSWSGGAWEVPSGVALDNGGNLYVAYSGGSSNFIQKFNTNGSGTRFASLGTNFLPGWLALDSHTNLFVINHGSNTVEKFSPGGVDLGTFGNATFQWPDVLAVDSKDNLFVSDLSGQKIWRFNSSGQGTVFVSGENYRGLAFDSSDNLYVGVGWNIDKFSTNGLNLGLLTPRPGEFVSEGLMFDKNGNLFFSDYLHSAICRFDALGRESTFATFTNGSSDLEALAVLSSGAPELLFARVPGGKIVLNWPAWASSYQLQSCTNLATANWIAVPGSPSTNSSRWWITNAVTGKAAFYRLRK